MNITIAISRHPISNLKRKILITELRLKESYISMSYVVHYYSEDDERIDDSNVQYIEREKNTVDSYINSNTGEYVYREMIDGKLQFPEGINVISEVDYLKAIPSSSLPSSTVWGKIEDLIKTWVKNLDSLKKFD